MSAISLPASARELLRTDAVAHVILSHVHGSGGAAPADGAS